MKKLFLAATLLGCGTVSQAQSFNQKYYRDGMYFFDDLQKVKQSELFTVHKAQFGLNADDSMAATNNIVDSNGQFNTKYELYHKGILVEGSLMNVIGQKGIVLYANGFIRTGLNVTNSGLITSAQAIDSAIAFVGASLYPWQDSTLESELKTESGDSTATHFPSIATLVVTKKRGDSFDHSASNYQLCYKVIIDAVNPRSKTEVFVNANTGQIFSSQDGWTHDYHRTGTGWTWYNGWYNNIKTRSCGTCFNYWLHDLDRSIYTTKFGKNYWQKGSYNKDNNNDWVENDTKSAATLHWGLQRSWDYFLYRHGRRGSNYASRRVHAITEGFDYFQAGFALSSADEDQIAIAQDGVFSGASSPGNPGYSIATLDVIGHEYTHAMVRASSALGVLGDFDARALNEGYADIFGNRIKRYSIGSTNWEIFEGIGAYKRSLNDPHSDKPNKSPEKYLEPGFWSSSNFHANGGVIRKWYYLIANGGTFNGQTVSSLGIEKADDIAYTTFNWWLWSNLNYPEAAQQTVSATIANWGKCSNEHRQVVNALRAVGFTVPNILCANVGIEGPRVVNVTQGTPVLWKGVLRQIEDEGGSYNWHIPDGWSAVATGNTITLNSTTNTSSQKLWVTYTTANISTSDTIVVHFSDEVWTPTPEPVVPQLRKTDDDNTLTQEANTGFSVYPNPAQNIINIKAPQDGELYTVLVYDFTGKKIQQFTSKDPNLAIDVTKWINGIYLLKINSNQQSHSEKITISH